MPSSPLFEDFYEGRDFRTPGRTIDMSDILMFAGLTGDHHPLHTDAEYAQKTQFGRRMAHGPLIYSMAVGLVALSDFYGDAILATKESQELRLLRPVFPEDTIYVELHVVTAVPTSKPAVGLLTVANMVVNQQAESIMSFRQVFTVRRGPST
jgi:3-hydroxybutyryl-CoA dehydratase